MYGTDERLCNGPIRLSVIGCSSTALCRSNLDCGGEMLSKEYLDTARTILRAAQTMTDQHVEVSLRCLPRTMSGELRKPHTLMRLRYWLAQLLANVKHYDELTIQKLNG